MRKLITVLSCITVAVLALGIGTTVAKADHPHEDSTKHCFCGGNCEGATVEGSPHTCSASSEATSWTGVSTYQELADKFATEADCFVYLKNDIDLTAVLKPQKGKKYSICLNGYTIKAPVNARAFTFSGCNTSTYIRICDCSTGMTGKITAHEDTTAVSDPGGLIAAYSGGRVWLFGGTVTGGRTSNKSGGGNIYVGNGTFYMLGGTVSNGKVVTATASDAKGGNISVYNTSTGSYLRFEMYGGTITNADTLEEGETGNAYKGGNLYVQTPTGVTTGPWVKMCGGTITGGTATNAGGNVYMIGYENSFTMTGGTISGGKINGKGGGGNIYCGIPFYMTGGTITGGHVLGTLDGGNGANLYLNKDATGNYIKGTAVFGNVHADSRAGGYNLAISSDCEIGENAEIGETGRVNTIQLNNTASALTVNGGLIYGMISAAYGTVEMNGGIVTGTVRATTYETDFGTVTINGGYVGKADRNKPEGAVILNGGYFGSIATANPVTYGAGMKAVEFNHSEPYKNETLVTNLVVIPEEAPIGKRLALNESLSIYFEGTIDTTVPYLKNGTKLSVSVDGAAAVEAGPEAVGTLTRYTYAGITPECMMDEIAADFISTGDDGNDYVLYTSTFTIKDYLDAVPTSEEYAAFSAGKKAAMDTLLTDLKVYGREAQKYFNHKTDNLIVAEDFAGSGRVPAGAAMTMDPVITAANVNGVDGYFKAATVIHENESWIRVQYKDNADDGETTFEVDSAAPELVQNNFVCTAGLTPTEFGTVKTFTAVRNGSPVATLTYSVNTYCASRHAKGDVFADALYNYGASAAAFATAE